MKETWFRIFTGLVGVYHLVLGLAGLLLPAETFAQVATYILGLIPETGGQFQLLTKFTSAYVLTFGISALLLMANPIKYRIIAIPVLVLFGIRLINKIAFFATIGESFGVSTGRNIFGVACVAIFFFGILLTLPKKKEA